MKRTADRLFGDQYRWSVLGAGRNQMPIAAMSAAMGGNVRVGLEDSLWIGPGQLAKSNAEQVTKARADHRGPRPRDRDARRGARDPRAQGRRQGRLLGKPAMALRRQGAAGTAVQRVARRKRCGSKWWSTSRRPSAKARSGTSSSSGSTGSTASAATSSAALPTAARSAPGTCRRRSARSHCARTARAPSARCKAAFTRSTSRPANAR